MSAPEVSMVRPECGSIVGLCALPESRKVTRSLRGGRSLSLLTRTTTDVYWYLLYSYVQDLVFLRVSSALYGPGINVQGFSHKKVYLYSVDIDFHSASRR